MIIYKYNLDITDSQTISFPIGAKILSAIEQNKFIVLYACVDENIENIEKYEIVIIGTGNPISIDVTNYTFLGTVSQFEGQLIWHGFYKKQ